MLEVVPVPVATKRKGAAMDPENSERFDDDSDTERPLLVDLIEFARGSSAKKHDSAVLTKYAAFAEQYNHPTFKNLAGLSDAALKKTIGEFCSFFIELYKANRKPGMQTVMNYLSAFRGLMEKELFGGQERMFAERRWYSSLRRTLVKRIASIAQQNGWRLIDTPDEIDACLLQEICRHFMELNTPYGVRMRA